MFNILLGCEDFGIRKIKFVAKTFLKVKTKFQKSVLLFSLQNLDLAFNDF